jgi:hypothetical protein
MIDLSDGKLHFHGYAQSRLERLRASLNRLDIVHGRPDVLEVSQCAVPPLRHRRKRVSSVYDSQNRMVELSARVRADERVGDVLDAQSLDGLRPDARAAYFLGYGEKHYGHFLLEVLCRAWAWEEHGEGRVPVLQSDVPQFARDCYALIPGILKRVEVIRSATRFSNVLVPGASFAIRRKAYTEFKRLCERMEDHATGAIRPPTEQPLYLSRTGLDSTRRSVIGEAWLEALLEREGFLVVRPESLPIQEQIALFNRHTWIVSTTGSACHTRLFARRPTNFVTITPESFNENHVLCDMLCEGNSHYVNALIMPDIGVDIDLLNVQPFVVDNHHLLATLKRLGLVRPSAGLDIPPPDLIAYKCRWIAAARWLANTKPPNRQQLLDAITAVANSLGARDRLLTRCWISLHQSGIRI